LKGEEKKGQGGPGVRYCIGREGKNEGQGKTKGGGRDNSTGSGELVGGDGH